MMSIELVWAIILGFSIFAYVILDGFDLGIGITYPFLKNGRERDIAMNTVAPVWDGNETWLVFGGRSDTFANRNTQALVFHLLGITL